MGRRLLWKKIRESIEFGRKLGLDSITNTINNRNMIVNYVGFIRRLKIRMSALSVYKKLLQAYKLVRRSGVTRA